MTITVRLKTPQAKKDYLALKAKLVKQQKTIQEWFEQKLSEG